MSVLMRLALVCLAALLIPAAAAAALQPSAQVSLGEAHSCVIRADGVRCWGFGGDGRLGYRAGDTIGDDETPGAAGPADLGAGGTARAVSAGRGHTCVLLDDATVRCWGFGGEGRLGYASTQNVVEASAAGPVDLGGPAAAIAAGGGHTCAVLADGAVRCWGTGFNGQLGRGDMEHIGDDETPGSTSPVELGARATAITAGELHTCALLEDGSVRCWGWGGNGRLGTGAVPPASGNGCDRVGCIGDDETPASIDPVYLGPNAKATAISAGGAHTCALLDDGSVRCWGSNGNGQLGLAHTRTIGYEQRPGDVDPVRLGERARAITAGADNTCAVLESLALRCWGWGVFGVLGSGSSASIGDDEHPASAEPVAVGANRTVKAVDLGNAHACAVLDDDHVRCWGHAANGRLGYCDDTRIGDDETPAAAGPVDFTSGNLGCPAPPSSNPPPPRASPPPAAPNPPSAPAPVPTPAPPPDWAAIEAARAQAYRDCVAAAGRRTAARRACAKRHGRTPGRVAGITARRLPGGRRVVLRFAAVASDGSFPPPSTRYVVKQSRTPLRTARGFRRASALCRGRCRFPVTAVGGPVELTVTGLRPRTTYYYAVAALDNVSGRIGPRSRAVRIRTAR